MNKSNKELLGELLEKIYKTFTSYGLHVCDLATGGGKSYTIAKLACQYYKNHFGRIVILCVQRKLVKSMYDEIMNHIGSGNNPITKDDVLLIKNNSEVIEEAIKNGSLSALVAKIKVCVSDKELQEKGKKNIGKLRIESKKVENCYNGLQGLFRTSSSELDYVKEQINEAEKNLRKSMRAFFYTYGIYLENKTGHKTKTRDILKIFPELAIVYPHVNVREKKILIMTIHKAMWGIDPILTENMTLNNITEKLSKKREQQGKKEGTLIIFDESDQAAISMRKVLYEMATGNISDNKKYNGGLEGLCHWKKLISDSEGIDYEYHGERLRKILDSTNKNIDKIWGRMFGDVPQFNSIRLSNIDELETYRRGTFFSGPIVKLNIGPKDNINSYICYQEGKKHITRVHSDTKEIDKMKYRYKIPMKDFLFNVERMRNTIINRLSVFVRKFQDISEKRYDSEIKDENSNGIYYTSYPSLEVETHTLIARFTDRSEKLYEQQILEYIRNRKNIKVNIKGTDYNFPDYSVYTRGFRFFQEEVDDQDSLHRVRISCRELITTPEKILLDLVMSGKTSIILNSATASSMSVISNFDMRYLKVILGDKFYELSQDDKKLFDELMRKTYPKQHEIEVISLDRYKFLDSRVNKWELPEKYRQMFSEKAREYGLDDEWFRKTKNGFLSKGYDDKGISYQFYRLFQFIEAYSWFNKNKNVHSMLFFQNRTGLYSDDFQQINVLSCLIDGTFINCEENTTIDWDWENENVEVTNNFDEVEKKVLKKLEDDKNAKVMLVAAYNSFKAGTNMQYKIPEGLDYEKGDDWEGENAYKKDWDAIYLQCPTSYLMMDGYPDEKKWEENLYDVMLSLMMLKERGCLSLDDVQSWIFKAISGAPFRFGCSGIRRDKAAWVQNTIIQAVGRTCRTKNKPHTTYILFDESISEYYEFVDGKMSMTREYLALVDKIRDLRCKKRVEEDEGSENAKDSDKSICCNLANYSSILLKLYRKRALHFSPHPFDDDDDDDDTEERIYNVIVAQFALQAFKKVIITKPVISSIDELVEFGDICKQAPFLEKCYGPWMRDKNNGYYFECDKNKPYHIVNDGVKEYVSASSVRLDILMKNDIIRKHFEDNHYATEWKKEGMILHPEILMYDYAGEIGEEAFRALVLAYTGFFLEHLEGKDYELADFVIKAADGSYRIAFDVKNFNPDSNHIDKKGDLSTTEKRRIKQERLGCRLVTVNIVKMKSDTIDSLNEISGIIDSNGVVIPSAIETIKKLINACLVKK